MTASPAAGNGRKRGRPSLAERAKGEPAAPERILASARAEFAARGYDRASIRAIARGAAVDPALVHHYFGTKEHVFEKAVETAFSPAITAARGQAVPGGADQLGEEMTRFLFDIWGHTATREPLLAILRSAVNNETAAEIFRRLVTRQLLAVLAGRLTAPDAELRVELAVAQLVGTALLRYVIKVEPIASTDLEVLISRLAPVVQHHLTGD